MLEAVDVAVVFMCYSENFPLAPMLLLPYGNEVAGRSLPAKRYFLQIEKLGRGFAVIQKSLLIIAFSLPLLHAQELKLRDKDGNIIEGVTIEKVESTETDRTVVHTGDPRSRADMTGIRLLNGEGKESLPKLEGKVTVIEYWSRASMPENLYWNRFRELEHQYAGNADIQLLSINYEYSLNGKHQLAAVKDFLQRYTNPSQLLFDVDDGMRDSFLIPGPSAYLLINHLGEYVNVGRGDEPETIKIFDAIQSVLDFKRSGADAIPVP